MLRLYVGLHGKDKQREGLLAREDANARIGLARVGVLSQGCHEGEIALPLCTLHPALVAWSLGHLTLENQVQPVLKNVGHPQLVAALEKFAGWLPRWCGLGVIRPCCQKLPTATIREPVLSDGPGVLCGVGCFSTFLFSPYQWV